MDVEVLLYLQRAQYLPVLKDVLVYLGLLYFTQLDGFIHKAKQWHNAGSLALSCTTDYSDHEQTNYIWGVIIRPTRFASEHFLQWKQDAILDTFRFVPSVYTPALARWLNESIGTLQT